MSQGLPNYSADQFIVAMMTTSVNEQRIHDDPPLLAVERQDQFLRSKIEDTLEMDARYWDYYRDIVQLSFLHGDSFTHFLMCGDIATKPYTEQQAASTIHMLDSDEDLVRGAFDYLGDHMGPLAHDDTLRDSFLLVGHRMTSEIWPTLANRAMRYRLTIPRDMKTDPEHRYSTVRHLADIQALYLQGGAPSRRAPGLPNILRSWGFCQDHRPMPEKIEEAVCEDAIGTTRFIESYLRDMHSMLTLYYGSNTKQTNELTGLAVPPYRPN